MLTLRALQNLCDTFLESIHRRERTGVREPRGIGSRRDMGGGGGSGAQKDRQQEGYGRGVLGSPEG